MSIKKLSENGNEIANNNPGRIDENEEDYHYFYSSGEEEIEKKEIGLNDNLH